ncbi:MAG: lipoyl(octanoyl) transferase LipB [Deltaproteobacteria bacterium]|nr:lipoyl(octanoyl) transferase LipB [Deltaproteobacteria bacterium]
MDASNQRALHWDYFPSLPYGEAESLQRHLRQALRHGEGQEHLLLLSHPHVYTLGRNADRSDILLSDSALEACGIDVHECDRGGQVTYHGPGQLVGYPILNLSPDRRDIRRYVRDLQEILILTLADFGIVARVREGQENIGVWVGEEKIASIGVHLSRWITTHGFALNVSTDLGQFSGIVACGLPSVKMTSMAALSSTCPPLSDVAAVCAGYFGRVFGRRLVRSQVPLVPISPSAASPVATS